MHIKLCTYIQFINKIKSYCRNRIRSTTYSTPRSEIMSSTSYHTEAPTSVLVSLTSTSTTTIPSTVTTEQQITESHEEVQQIYDETETIIEPDSSNDNFSVETSEVQQSVEETTTETRAQLNSRGKVLDSLPSMFPSWSWARNIMLEKPVLKKTSSV